MRSFLALAVLAAAVPRASAQSAPVEVTCADKAAAGITEACVVPYTFTNTATVLVNGAHVSLPPAGQGAPPSCYTQEYMNQLATPTFMPRNSSCSAYANRGCCSSETVRRRVRSCDAPRDPDLDACALQTLLFWADGTPPRPLAASTTCST